MKVKVKRSGGLFIAITILLGVAATNTGNNLLYMVVSSLLSLMLVSGIVSLVNIKGLKVRVIPPPEVYAGRRSAFRVVVSKDGKLPSFLVTISSDLDRCLIPVVNDSDSECTLSFEFPKRGHVNALKLTISSDFPLGVFIRSMEVEVPVMLTVFPKPIPASPALPAGGSRSKGLADKPSLSRGYEELRNLKDYAGEPMKLIHWKLSAKRGKLIVKEMSGEQRKRVVLSLDMVEGNLEEKLSKLTYLTVWLMENNFAVGLRLKGKEVPPGWGETHKRILLRELALY